MPRIASGSELESTQSASAQFTGGAYDEFRQRALILMYRWNVNGWKFVWTPQAKNRAGVTRHRKKELGFAPWAVEWPIDDQIDLILHEIAHVLVGPGNGHNSKWKAKARLVGAEPTRCYDSSRPELDDPRPKGKWIVTCKVHGEVDRMHRKPRVVRSCAQCSSKFDVRFKLSVVHEETGQVAY